MNSRQKELALFSLALAAANAPLLCGRICTALLFVPSQVAGGEWWRVLTGPLVHVSAYHLLLDAGAFLMLFHGLRAASAARRLLTVAACATGSLAFALPALGSCGSLCGLSGVAHGLLAVTALEMISDGDRTTARIGWAALLLVAGKSIIEALSGHVLFESLHLGDVATPIAVCHLGGVIGGLSAHACFAVLDGRIPDSLTDRARRSRATWRGCIRKHDPRKNINELRKMKAACNELASRLLGLCRGAAKPINGRADVPGISLDADGIPS